MRRHAPEDRLESELVESLVLVMIKLRRLDRLELEAMERAVMSGDMNKPDDAADRQRYPTLATLGRYRGRLNHERKLAEDRLTTILRHRPTPGSVLELGASQLRFLVEMAEETEAEKARFAVDHAAEALVANRNGTKESGIAGGEPKFTNEKGLDALVGDLMGEIKVKLGSKEAGLSGPELDAAILDHLRAA